MSDQNGNVKEIETQESIDFEFIISTMESFAKMHEEKALSSRCFISRWRHRRKARKEIENAALIRRIQIRCEGQEG